MQLQTQPVLLDRTFLQHAGKAAEEGEEICKDVNFIPATLTTTDGCEYIAYVKCILEEDATYLLWVSLSLSFSLPPPLSRFLVYV